MEEFRRWYIWEFKSLISWRIFSLDLNIWGTGIDSIHSKHISLHLCYSELMNDEWSHAFGMCILLFHHDIMIWLCFWKWFLSFLSLKREERTSFFIHTQWIDSFALWCMLSRMKDNWCSKENTHCYSIWMSSISCFVNRLSTNDHQWKKSVQNNHFFFMM